MFGFEVLGTITDRCPIANEIHHVETWEKSWDGDRVVKVINAGGLLVP